MTSSPSRRSRGGASSSEALITAAVLATLATSVPAQRQFDELGKRGLPADRDTTQAVAVGDVDGDGDLDMVAGNGGYGRLRNQNRLYLNDGSGVYADATAQLLPAYDDNTLSVALGDVDGDSDLDIVFGNGGRYGIGGQNRLYLNDGSGSFTDATAARLPPDNDYASAVAFGDVDGDGDLDLIVGNGRGGLVAQNRLYLNDGAGTFTDATVQRLPALIDRTSGVAVGDVDGDSDLDIVFVNNQHNNRLYLNDGTGIYTDATANQLPLFSSMTWSVAMGDVDGDGDLDLALGVYMRPNRLYLNDGTGTFTDATSQNLPSVLDFTQAVSLGDLDGDGDLDLVFGNVASRFPNYGQNDLFLNDGNGVYADATAGRMPAVLDDSMTLALGDVDGDADLDLITGNGFVSGQQNRLSLNDGAARFTNTSALRLSQRENEAKAVATGDVDGDDDLDIVFASGRSGEPDRLHLNDGTGTYTDATQRLPNPSDQTEAVAFGDVDGDGDLDMVLGTAGRTTENRLYLNDGAGLFTDATSRQMPRDGEDTNAVALGDVDGDGDLDIVCGNGGSFGSGQNRLYLNDGTGIYTDVAAAMPVLRDETLAVALGDVDGDGDVDVVFGNGIKAREQNRLLLNDGTGTFTDVTAARLPVDTDWTQSLALGDVDGDGDLDLVLGNGYDRFNGQLNRLYLNDGSGSFTNATATLLPADRDNTHAVALGDLDGDGDLDLICGNDQFCVITNCQPAPNRLYVNDGSGFFTDATARMPTCLDRTEAVALGDFDGDGDLDVVFGNYREGNRLYLNLMRQLDAPLVALVGRPFTLEAYHRSPSLLDVAMPFLSTGTARLSLPPYGMFGLDPTQMVALPPIVIQQPAGVGCSSLTVPNVPGLVGISFYTQALIVPYWSPGRLTNVNADVIAR